jgi:heme A synthase
MAASDRAARAWTSVRRGLGWTQFGVVLLFLAAAACPGIELAEAFGAKLPDRDPGFLKLDNLSSAYEIRGGATAIPALLGVLCVVLGRLGASGAPRESLGRGMGRAAAWGTIFAFLGLLACGIVTGLSTANGSPPKIIPHKDVTKPGVRIQERAERYFAHVFLAAGEPTGQIQRIGFVVMLVFGVVAEVWFLSALGRYATALQGSYAARRVTGVQVLLGLLFALFWIALLAYDLYGVGSADDQIKQKWNDLGDKGRVGVVCGGLIGVAFIFAVIYYRVLGGVKQAIRDAYDPMSAV